ncbi:MAG: glutamine-hydrolyzing GMP synthase, partial [bacterium]
MQETILILDFGSQYTQLIARRVRELSVYCEIHPDNKVPEISGEIKGVILSGSPFSVRDAESPKPELGQFKGKLPLLGVCYGAQYLAHEAGGEVLPSKIREYGRANLGYIHRQSPLMKDISENSQVWMSHGDTILSLPEEFEVITSTESVEVAGYHIQGEETYGIQFHPEVYHTEEGKQLLRNFLVNICGCHQEWTPDSFIETTVQELKDKLGNDKVVLGLSGGVDSSVAAMLLHHAIGKNLYCIFVDNGLLRKNEFHDVLHSYRDMGLNVKGVDASQRFLMALEDVEDPEAKRKIIGNMFIDVFDHEAHLIADVKWLAQGTIYPDVIESVSVKGPSATIKSHHNVGGLPDFMKLNVVEPLNSLFKDEVRKIGRAMDMPSEIIDRHPFPGPGLGIRLIGGITDERVRILQDVDDIYISNMKKMGLYNEVWQAFAVLLPVQTVGVMGDERT